MANMYSVRTGAGVMFPYLLCFRLIGGSDYKLIYRHYATLYFVFCVDSSESELGILDLIQVKGRKTIEYLLPCLAMASLFFFSLNSFHFQVFVETLDKCFENVCELDLIFHVDKVGNTFEPLSDFTYL